MTGSAFEVGGEPVQEDAGESGDRPLSGDLELGWGPSGDSEGWASAEVTLSLGTRAS